MRNMRLTGPGAGSEKYDLLTAMAVDGLAMGGVTQSSMMRLMALVTARYNWALDELSIGQKDMASLWSVDERTAKRETKRLVDARLLEIKRPGVRGRVAVYRLNAAEVYRRSEPHWSNVGTDFQSRMGSRAPTAQAGRPSSETVVKVDFTSGTRAEHVVAQPEAADPWQRAQHRLSALHPTLFPAWFASLKFVAIVGEQVRLTAPSRFAAQYITTHFLGHLEDALRHELGSLVNCIIMADSGR